MDDLLKQGWNETDNKLIKEYELSDFAEGINFINQIAVEAENIDHHPDIRLHDYKKVEIVLTTHAANKITRLDISLAKKIDVIYESLSRN